MIQPNNKTDDSLYVYFKNKREEVFLLVQKYQGYIIMTHLQKKTEHFLLEKERVIEKNRLENHF